MTSPDPADGFRVDVDGTGQAIKELENALRELHSIRHQARELEQVSPPTNDPVSREAARILGNMATAGKGSFGTALDEGIAQLQVTVDALRAALPAYEASDEAGVVPVDS